MLAYRRRDVLLNGQSWLTVKKPSPGPKTRLGRKMVAVGFSPRTACSPSPLVRQLEQKVTG